MYEVMWNCKTQYVANMARVEALYRMLRETAEGYFEFGYREVGEWKKWEDPPAEEESDE